MIKQRALKCEDVPGLSRWAKISYKREVEGLQSIVRKVMMEVRCQSDARKRHKSRNTISHWKLKKARNKMVSPYGLSNKPK